jgi:O-antigen/teichoic acid export membrane protein
LIIALIYPAVKNFGLVGAATAGLIAMALSILLQVIRMREITHFDLRKYGATFLRALRTSLSVAAFWLITRHLCPSQPLLSVFLGAMGCLLAYALSIMVSWRSHGKGSILFMASHEKQA